MDKIIIIGAGVAGMGAALDLAKAGFKVVVIEEHGLGYGSSSRNAARMGHGFHYTDLETAKTCLRASINVQREYPGFLLEPSADSPLAHGRYFIMRNSVPSKEVVLQRYTALQEEYCRLIKDDPRNEVFGPPDKFFRILDPSEYENLVNTENIALGIETNEHLFRWDSFLRIMRIRLETHPNIELQEHTKVLNIKRKMEGANRFVLETKNENGDCVDLEANTIVNSTWENIELLNAGLGIVSEPRTNRLKVILEVELPLVLHECNSMFFCFGPFGMMVNLGGGKAMITYAEITNVEMITDLKLSEKAERLYHQGPTADEVQHYGQLILDGIKRFIPALEKAKIVALKFGFVQTDGKLSKNLVQDPTDDYHKRVNHGVRAEQVGLVSNPSRKLFYFKDNAQLVLQHIREFEKADELIEQTMQSLREQLQSEQLQLTPKTERRSRQKLECRNIPELLASSSAELQKELRSDIKVQASLNALSFLTGNKQPQDCATSSNQLQI
ncbi:MAG: FAD-binding oxidoreductase [Legionella sp.]|nr:MAG: FAD-binding oxidoreductase [Legionella sp.]